MREYIFLSENEKVMNVLLYKKSQNSKLGYDFNLLTTYHFGVNQIANQDLTLDQESCVNCPLSYSGKNKIGSCYTHGGFSRLGLNAMMKRLHFYLPKVEQFNQGAFKYFINMLGPVDMLRLSTYGEATHMDLGTIETLIEVSNRQYTAYTQRWNEPKFLEYKKYFMASVHDPFSKKIAEDLGWRVFWASTEKESNSENVLCPASKLGGKKATCVTCKLCSGTLSNSKKSIWIPRH